MSDPATVTQLLNAAQSGDSVSVDRLFPLIYDELRHRAHAQRAGFGGHATLNTTAIVHEAYVKMAGAEGGAWQNRAHFFGVASKAMRHVFLDYAKRKNRQKRGDGIPSTSLEDTHEGAWASKIGDQEADQIIALEAALAKLSTINERAARVVECRFYGGMTVEDTAAVLNLSTATVKRDWMLAKALLYRTLSEDG